MTTINENTVAHDTEQARQRILDAAAASFLKRGFPESSVSDIFEAAGVAPELGHELFPRKHDLIIELAGFNKATGSGMLFGLAEENPLPPTAEYIARVMELVWPSV